MDVFAARYRGRCAADCGERIDPGDDVTYVGDELLRWRRYGSEVVHLGTQGSTAAYCGISLHDATAVASNRRICGHCARSTKR